MAVARPDVSSGTNVELTEDAATPPTRSPFWASVIVALLTEVTSSAGYVLTEPVVLPSNARVCVNQEILKVSPAGSAYVEVVQPAMTPQPTAMAEPTVPADAVPKDAAGPAAFHDAHVRGGDPTAEEQLPASVRAEREPASAAGERASAVGKPASDGAPSVSEPSDVRAPQATAPSAHSAARERTVARIGREQEAPHPA